VIEEAGTGRKRWGSGRFCKMGKRGARGGAATGTGRDTTGSESIFKKLRGQGKLSEENILPRRCATVHGVPNDWTDRQLSRAFKEILPPTSRPKAMGQRGGLPAITPGPQFVKIVFDELSALMGSSAKTLSSIPTASISVVSGRTSGLGKNHRPRAKLALYYPRSRVTGRCLSPAIRTGPPQ